MVAKRLIAKAASRNLLAEMRIVPAVNCRARSKNSLQIKRSNRNARPPDIACEACENFESGKPTLLSGPIGLCGICLRRIRPRVSGHRRRNRTALQRRFENPKPFISAPDDVPGIRRTTPPPRRWRRTNISPTRSSKAPASPTLGGEYFFLHDRHRAHRPAGHERDDALEYFRKLGGTAFVKPLTGSRGDFAQAIDGEASLLRYLGEVSQYYDAILIQPMVSGTEYRIFLLDGEILYSARKYPPFVLGDGVSSHPRSAGRAQRRLAIPRTFAGSPRRTATPRSTPCCPRANAGTLPGG